MTVADVKVADVKVGVTGRADMTGSTDPIGAGSTGTGSAGSADSTGSTDLAGVAGSTDLADSVALTGSAGTAALTGLTGVMIRSIRWYQRRISANRPACCKYYPTCSRYAIEALERYGALKGGLLAALRLLRCRPWSRGGIDDVPQRYSVFYRFSWSKAHEEPRLTPLAWHDDSVGSAPSVDCASRHAEQ